LDDRKQRLNSDDGIGRGGDIHTVHFVSENAYNKSVNKNQEIYDKREMHVVQYFSLLTKSSQRTSTGAQKI
jgi:hypothetical protein